MDVIVAATLKVHVLSGVGSVLSIFLTALWYYTAVPNWLFSRLRRLPTTRRLFLFNSDFPFFWASHHGCRI